MVFEWLMIHDSIFSFPKTASIYMLEIWLINIC